MYMEEGKRDILRKRAREFDIYLPIIWPKSLKVDKYFVEELNKTFKSYQEIADYLKVDRVTIYNLMIGKKTRLKKLTIRKI